MYKATVNNDPPREIEFSGDEFTIDGQHGTWDKITVGKNRFHILRNNRSYNCEVIEAVKEKKSFLIRVNGATCTVSVKDRFDELLKQLGMEGNSVVKLNVLKAPMPGLVLKIMGEKGQEVKQGDSLLILEAMKMENIIKSPGNGTVKSIHVSPGAAVEKGQTLMEFM